MDWYFRIIQERASFALPEHCLKIAKVECVEQSLRATEQSGRFIYRHQLLDAQKKHLSRAGYTHVGVEHRVIEVGFWPFQPEGLPDVRSSRFVRSIDLVDCLVLGCPLGDQPADLAIARCIEEHSEDILAIA